MQQYRPACVAWRACFLINKALSMKLSKFQCLYICDARQRGRVGASCSPHRGQIVLRRICLDKCRINVAVPEVTTFLVMSRRHHIRIDGSMTQYHSCCV